MNDSWFEGVGDEVLQFALGFAIAIAAAALMLHYCGRRLPPSIHPGSRQGIERLREEIRNNREQERHHDGEPEEPGEGEGSHRDRMRGRCTDTCPICLQDPTGPVETSCGHIFCGACLVTYWRTGSWLEPVRCPVCRSPVSLLIPLYEQESNTDLTDTIREYNHLMCEQPRTIMTQIRELPTLFRLLCRAVFSNGASLAPLLSLRLFVTLFASAFYLIWPWDGLPEAALGFIGFADDLLLLLCLGIWLIRLARSLAPH
uniref:E3 ubiquitin-protein ligase RNF170-like isoform X2 n=1 Tax=Myxine glutinosa TaxID=7769 RepID=UPI00358E6682